MAGLEGMQLGSCVIMRRIGGGAMGDVYLAEQRDLQRRVAVKVIHGESGVGVSREAMAKAVDQFTREARAVAALSHPHILPIYEFGEQNGLHYLVMEYVPSGSLATVDLYNLPMSPPLVAELMLQAGSALQFAHDHGIMHLDVKPQNLLVKMLPLSAIGVAPQDVPTGDTLMTSQGQMRLSVLLADFGLARLTTTVSAYSSIAGTPLYAPPEQYAGEPVPATDQYALAGVAFLLLTGRPVFGGTLAELYHQHMSVPPPLANSVNPTLSPAIGAVLARALAKDPAQRFPTVREFAQALAIAIHQGVAPAWAPTPANDDPTLSPARLAPPPIQTAPPATPVSGASPIAPAGFTPPGVTGAPMMTPPAVGPAAGAAQPIAASGPLAQRATGSMPLGAPSDASAPGWREPDGMLAPLPRERFELPPYWRIVAACLVFALVVGAGAGIIIARAHQPSPPTLLPSEAAHIHSSGVAINANATVLLSHVPTFSAAPVANEQTTTISLPLASDTPGATGGTSGTISNLPQFPTSYGATVGTPFGLDSTTVALPPTKRTPGLSEGETGSSQVMNTTVASDGTVVLEAVDGMLLTHNTITQTPGARSRYSLAAFFRPVLSSGALLGEPQALYDQALNRWILLVSNVQMSNGQVTSGALDLAISSTESLSDVWYLYQFSSQLPSLSTCNWAASPRLGLAGADLFVSGVSFACGSAGPKRQSLGAETWVLPLQSFANGSPVEITLLSGFTNAQGQRALNLTPAVESASDNIEWLMSDDADPTNPNTVSNHVALWAIQGATNTANASSGLSALSGQLALPFSYANPAPAEQAGTQKLLDTGDARITQLIGLHGHLYAALATGVNWAGDSATRAAAFWFEITPTAYTQGATHGIGAQFNQVSLIGAPNLSIFYPVLVVDARGNVGLFAQLSSATTDLSVVYAPHYAQSAPASLGHPDKVASISQSVAPFLGEHWGDQAGGCMTTLSSASNTGLAWVAIPSEVSEKTPSGAISEAWHTNLWQVQL